MSLPEKRGSKRAGGGREGLLPDNKLNLIATELERYNTVGMAGHGINDAPALAKASLLVVLNG